MNAFVLETNQTLAQRYRAELWNGRQETADEITAPDCVFHVNDSFTPALDPGPAALKQLVVMYRTAFPDTSFSVEDLVVDAAKAVVRWRGGGTQQGALGAIAATGSRSASPGLICSTSKTAKWSRSGRIGMRSDC